MTHGFWLYDLHEQKQKNGSPTLTLCIKSSTSHLLLTKVRLCLMEPFRSMRVLFTRILCWFIICILICSSFRNSLRTSQRCALRRVYLVFWTLKDILFAEFPLLVKFFFANSLKSFGPSQYLMVGSSFNIWKWDRRLELFIFDLLSRLSSLGLIQRLPKLNYEKTSCVPPLLSPKYGQCFLGPYKQSDD